jgi:hypothetical protein
MVSPESTAGHDKQLWNGTFAHDADHCSADDP